MGVRLTPTRLRDACRELTDHAGAHGGDCPHVLRLVFADVTDDVDGGRHEAAQLVEGQYGSPLERLARWLHVTRTEEVADSLAGYRDAGADGIVVVP